MSSHPYKQFIRVGPVFQRYAIFRHALVGVLGALLGIASGAAVAFGPFWAAFVVLLVLACGYALLVDTNVGLAGVVLIATILPFGTLPFKAVITPNFLELTLIALLGVWLLRLLTNPDQTLILTPLGLPILGFLGLTLLSFLLGSNGSPDSLTLHNYFKFVLSVLFFFSVVNCVLNRTQARWMIRFLLIGGMLSALIGLVLYLMPDRSALQVLTAFGRIGYPTSGRVLRYIADDPSGIERAIGLSVDPNSFGGMLALVGTLAITQMISRQPALPRALLIGASGVIALTVFLTQSRGALGGLLVGVVYAATFRYHRLWWMILAVGLIGVVLIGLGFGEQFIGRVVDGLQFRDQANQMRLNEYQNAIAVIRAYPVFGIGFAQAPELDLVAGVSSIYLAIAQRTGLVGLFAFLGIVTAFFVRSWHALGVSLQNDEERVAWIVGLQASIAAALAVGLLDHYFFNIEFSHMVALFWGTIGLALALENVEERSSVAIDVSS